MKVKIIALWEDLRKFHIGPLLLAGLLFRGLIAYFLPPGFDEAYYFLYTQHLSWSYFDHPLAVALTTGIGVWLTGIVSPFTIRFGALGLFTAGLWLLYGTGCKLFGARAGWLSCLVASLSPLLILTFGTLTAPDNALIFFWSAAMYLGAYEFFQGEKQPYRPTSKIAWIGLAVGLACLSKYHGAVLGLGLVGFCATHRREALRSRWMLLSTVLFCACLLPIGYWNAQHDWISLRFQLGDRIHNPITHYSVLNFAGVLLTEVGFLFPTLGIPLWWVSSREFIKAARHAFRSRLTPYPTQIDRAQVDFILWLGLPVALGFTLLGGLTPIYPAWPAPGLWTLTLLLGRAAASWPQKKHHQWLQYTGLIAGTLMLFALTHITLGTLQKPGQYALFGGFISPQADPSTALIDVQQLREQLSKSDEFWQALATTDFIITHEFWLSGYIAMALPPSVNLSVGSFTEDPRGHAFWFDTQAQIGKDALFVSLADFNQGEVLEAIAPYFKSIAGAGTVTTQRGNAITETFYLYRAQQLLKPYPYPY